jgi:hypothetical protein
MMRRGCRVAQLNCFVMTLLTKALFLPQRLPPLRARRTEMSEAEVSIEKLRSLQIASRGTRSWKTFCDAVALGSCDVGSLAPVDAGLFPRQLAER